MAAYITIDPSKWAQREPLFSIASREAWLGQVASMIRPLLESAGATMPEAIRYSCGWPAGGRGVDTSKRIGECWYAPSSADHTIEIFVSPAVGDALIAASTLAHELIHACLDMDAGHGPKFRKLALAIGLEGKMTATVPGNELSMNLQSIIEVVGPYPHAQLRKGEAADKPKKQTTRMIKLVCECGYTVRTTRTWIDYGLPTCPCGEDMIEEGAEDGE